jgi:hypothetical protein
MIFRVKPDWYLLSYWKVKTAILIDVLMLILLWLYVSLLLFGLRLKIRGIIFIDVLMLLLISLSVGLLFWVQRHCPVCRFGKKLFTGFSRFSKIFKRQDKVVKT